MRLTARPLQLCPRGHPESYSQVDLRVQTLAHPTHAREVRRRSHQSASYSLTWRVRKCPTGVQLLTSLNLW
eukprot:6064088-Heterocapsa_arctica.AAC.1